METANWLELASGSIAPEVLARRLRPVLDRPAGSLVVHEVYRSIQGESTYAGLPCTFVRLTACHLRCNYCDTAHAFTQGAVRTLDDVVAEALATGDPLVEITGGEPLLQAEVYSLMTRLLDAGRTVLLETSGAVDTARVDPRVVVILDVKPPGSGEVASNVPANWKRLRPTDEVKYVVSSRDDFDWSVAHIREHSIADRAKILMGAVFGRVNPTDLAAWIMTTGLPIRLQIQLHKILWDPAARGSDFDGLASEVALRRDLPVDLGDQPTHFALNGEGVVLLQGDLPHQESSNPIQEKFRLDQTSALDQPGGDQVGSILLGLMDLGRQPSPDRRPITSRRQSQVVEVVLKHDRTPSFGAGADQVAGSTLDTLVGRNPGKHLRGIVAG